MKDRKQFISFEHSKKPTVFLGPLLFLLYVNDLQHASKVLNPIMFAEDINLFFPHSDINVLFEKANKVLTTVSNLLNANKLSLNVEKTNHSFFHNSSKKDNIPIELTNLNTNGLTVERESSKKDLEV